MAKELDAQEKALLSRKTNQCAGEQVLAAAHGSKVSDLKKEIGVILRTHGLSLHETGDAFARIDTETKRKTDGKSVDKIRKIVDPEDLDVICPRKVDLKALDEVIGHHRYPALDKVLGTRTSTRLTIGQLAG